MKKICTSNLVFSLFVLSFLFFIPTTSVFSQGCSDAGFCTMGAMRPDQPFSKKLNIRLRSVSLTQYIGLTKFDDKILS